MLGKNQYAMTVIEKNSVHLDELTSHLCPKRNKILFIDTSNSFNEFTDMYGYIDEDNIIRIKWPFVARDYKGIGLSSFHIGEEKYYRAEYLGKEFASWWYNEYILDSSFIVFDQVVEFSEQVNNEYTQVTSKIISPYTKKQAASMAFTKLLRRVVNSKISQANDSDSDKKSMEPKLEKLSDENYDDSSEEDYDDSSDEDYVPKKATVKNLRPVSKPSAPTRIFRTIDPETGKMCGRFTGETPKQAATKALTILMRKRQSNKEAGTESVKEPIEKTDTESVKEPIEKTDMDSDKKSLEPVNNVSGSKTESSDDSSDEDNVSGSETESSGDSSDEDYVPKTASVKISQPVHKSSPRIRYFKLVDPETGKTFGRYTGETPKQAASKGFTKYLQNLRSNGVIFDNSIVKNILLRESTRGSARKRYAYSASRQKLEEPQKLTIMDHNTGELKSIVYNYRNRINKIPLSDLVHDE